MGMDRTVHGQTFRGEQKMKNEDIERAVGGIFKRLREIETKLAFIEGTVKEMQRHNSKIIKFLMAIIVALFLIIGALLGIKVWVA